MPKVLIADDDQNNREVVRDALADEGYELLEARDGRAALEIIAKEKPDVVLLDVMMPGADGLIVLNLLMQSGDADRVKVIMLTALNTDTQITECLDAGASDYITKPFSNMILRARVRNALKRSSGEKSQEDATGAVRPRGRVLAFIGSKGGVGATTTAVNVATSLAEGGSRVNFWEVPTGFATSAQQMRLIATRHSADLLAKAAGEIDETRINDLLTAHRGGLKLLLNPPPARECAAVTPQHAEAIVDRMARLAEVTVIDVQPRPADVAQAVLRRADFIGIVCEHDPLAWEAAGTMMRKLREWKIEDTAVGLVVTSRAPVSSAPNLPAVRDALGCKIVGVIPPDPDRFLTALRRGTPIVIDDPTCIASEALRAMAQRVSSAQVPALSF